MKICFDHQIFTTQKAGGISRYFKYLIDGIKNQENDRYLLSVLYSENIYLQPEDISSPIGKLKFLFNTQKKIAKRNKSYAKRLLQQNNFDVFHPTYFDPYYLPLVKKPTVVTVHDMTYEALPHLFPADDPTPYHKRLVMEKADKLIAISENTKADILKFTNIPEAKIEVIHHGIELHTPAYAEVKNLPTNYILFVGGRWSYKNFYLLVDAFTNLSKTYPDLFLILAGGGNLSYGDSEYLYRKKISDKVIHLNPTDPQLNTLYKNSKCFVYPSSYEGFGFPILEAFKNNCPVLLNNNACFKEIAGEAASYFEDNELESLITSLDSILNNQINTEEISLAAKQRLLKFPIQKCVDNTLSLYHSF
jgi:glycosyltransferase involved in cell wall biosynthesis